MVFVMNSTTILINLYHLLLPSPFRVVRIGYMRFLNLLVSIEIQIIILLHIPAIGPKLLLLSIFLTDVVRIVIYHLDCLVVHHLHFIGHGIQLVLYLGHIVVYVVLSFVLFLLVIHVVYFF